MHFGGKKKPKPNQIKTHPSPHKQQQQQKQLIPLTPQKKKKTNLKTSPTTMFYEFLACKLSGEFFRHQNPDHMSVSSVTLQETSS